MPCGVTRDGHEREHWAETAPVAGRCPPRAAAQRGEVEKPEVRGVRVESLETGRPEMRQTMDRADAPPTRG